MSNSKLSKEQKDWLKNVKRDFPSIKLFTYGRVTFAYSLTEHKGCVSWSIASDKEIKIRAKVGEYYAMKRFLEGKTLPIEHWNDYTFGEYLQEFSSYIALENY
jgi:hypothetical protein